VRVHLTLEYLRGDAQSFRHKRHIAPAFDLILDLTQEWRKPIYAIRLPGGIPEIHKTCRSGQQVVDKADRLVNMPQELLTRMLSQETVRILALGQGHHADAHTSVQEEPDAAFRGCPTGSITVKDQHDLFDHALEQPYLILSQRCTQCPDCMRDALTVTGNDVGIPFYDQRLLALPQGRFGQSEPVEKTPLMKDRCLWRVQIFRDMCGLAALKRTAPKSDGAPQTIVNGKHETMVKAVMGPALGLTHYGKPTLDQQFLGKPLFVHGLTQGIPGCRRIP
jgi:ferredoxin